MSRFGPRGVATERGLEFDLAASRYLGIYVSFRLEPERAGLPRIFKHPALSVTVHRFRCIPLARFHVSSQLLVLLAQFLVNSGIDSQSGGLFVQTS